MKLVYTTESLKTGILFTKLVTNFVLQKISSFHMLKVKCQRVRY